MTNNKFLKIGAAALATLALSAAISMNHSHADVQPQANPVVATAQAETEDANPHNFITLQMSNKPASESRPAGSVREVTYQGKVIGEIRQFATYTQTKTNLTPEQTVKLYHELIKTEKGEHLTLADGSEKSPEYKSIVFDLGKETKTYLNDVEAVVLSASFAYRTDSVAATPNKTDVAQNIKNTRAKFIEQNTYNPGLYKPTQG